MPFISIGGGAVIGNNFEGELPQVGNTFTWADNLSWVKGNHTLKFGADVQRSLFDQTLYYNVNGWYTFDSTGYNALSYDSNYPGFLLGLADAYSQGSAQTEHVRSTGLSLFAQDSWKMKPSLTLNYGLRWELTTPLTDASRTRADLPARTRTAPSIHVLILRLKIVRRDWLCLEIQEFPLD